MDIKEKTGDFFLYMAKMVFGGVILASIVSEDIDRMWLYIIGFTVFLIFAGGAYLFYLLDKKKGE